MFQPQLERPHPAGLGGVQKVYHFGNDYGASVVQFPGSYGFKQGLWELAVVRFNSDDILDFYLSYDTPVTDDVLGYLTEDEVQQQLVVIESLSPVPGSASGDGDTQEE